MRAALRTPARAPLTVAWHRRASNLLMLGLCVLGLGITVVVLVAILGYVIAQGASSLNLEFFVNTPKPVGETGGGMANAIAGSFILIVVAILVGLPIGIAAGLYLAEPRSESFARIVRFVADVLTGIPTITIGLFAYGLLVVPFKSFSALAGGVALAIIMLPVVTRTTEEMVRLVPGSLREAALALGVPRWKVTLQVILPTALGGIVTGALLAVARVAGETAPLLFTAFGNQFWSQNLREPIAAMPLQIFTYAISPYDDWHRQAWAGALVLVALILLLSVGARIYVNQRKGGGSL